VADGLAAGEFDPLQLGGGVEDEPAQQVGEQGRGVNLLSPLGDVPCLNQQLGREARRPAARGETDPQLEAQSLRQAGQGADLQVLPGLELADPGLRDPDQRAQLRRREAPLAPSKAQQPAGPARLVVI